MSSENLTGTPGNVNTLDRAGKWKLVMTFLLGFAAAHGLDLMLNVGGQRTLMTSRPFPKSESSELYQLETAPEAGGATFVNQNLRSYSGMAVSAQITERPTKPPTTPPTQPPTQPAAQDKRSGFDAIVSTAYERALHVPDNFTSVERAKFDITYWEQSSNLTTRGGLKTEDRILLAQLYGNASSVFEYGLGESTYMADYLGVPRYAGIDSDPVWVGMARDKVSSHYRFYLGDIGETGAWGYPKERNNIPSKSVLTYQLSPLIVERQPFDVYMVDGRWRLPSALASFLHASDRGADHSKTTVLIHDCFNHTDSGRVGYKNAEHLLELVDHSSNLLCVYKRRPETTDEQLKECWHQYVDQVER